MIRARMEAPFKFVVVGFANTLIGLLAIYLCKWLLGFGDVLANVTGYGIGLAFSFALNRAWTFRHSGPWLKSLYRFLVVFVLAYVLNLTTVLVAIRYYGANPYVAQALGIVPYTTFFYFGSRYFAFRAAPAVKQ